MELNMVYVVSERPAVGRSGPMVVPEGLSRYPSLIPDWPCILVPIFAKSNVVFSNSNKDTLLDMLRFELFFSQGVGQAAVRCNRLVSGRPGLQSGSRTDIIWVSNGRQSGMS